MLRASVTGYARNREEHTRTSGRPAHECSRMVLSAVIDRDYAVRQIGAMERSTPHTYAREHIAHTERMKRALVTADSIRGGLIAGSAG